MDINLTIPEREELEYLRFFYKQADFWPADRDVRMVLENRYKKVTNKELPEGYTRDTDE